LSISFTGKVGNVCREVRVKRIRRGVVLAVGLVTLSAVLVGVGGVGAGASEAAPSKAKPLPAAELALVSYSTPQAAFKEIIAAFRKTTQGKNITFTQSFGASGEQSRAVAAGQKADVVEFSLEPDITRLVQAGIVDASWNQNKYKGFVTNSVVVIGTRQGNPKKIKDWKDLTKSGVEVITPNPFTSGGARWNVLAGYGAESNVNQNQQAGVDYLNKLFDNVPVQDDSARASLQTFASGKGDAVLAYENEAIFAKQQGQGFPYTIPTKTILIQNPVAVTKNSEHPEQAKAFVDFLYTKTAQKIFANNGYRPVVSGVASKNRFTTPSGLFTIDQLGGWSDAAKKFFDPNSGLLVQVERGKGVPTSP
jgi:sulfate transport system substrate-binding protein